MAGDSGELTDPWYIQTFPTTSNQRDLRMGTTHLSMQLILEPTRYPDTRFQPLVRDLGNRGLEASGDPPDQQALEPSDS